MNIGCGWLKLTQSERLSVELLSPSFKRLYLSNEGLPSPNAKFHKPKLSSELISYMAVNKDIKESIVQQCDRAARVVDAPHKWGTWG